MEESSRKSLMTLRRNLVGILEYNLPLINLEILAKSFKITLASVSRVFGILRLTCEGEILRKILNKLSNELLEEVSGGSNREIYYWKKIVKIFENFGRSPQRIL